MSRVQALAPPVVESRIVNARVQRSTFSKDESASHRFPLDSRREYQWGDITTVSTTWRTSSRSALAFDSSLLLKSSLRDEFTASRNPAIINIYFYLLLFEVVHFRVLTLRNIEVRFGIEMEYRSR